MQILDLTNHVIDLTEKGDIKSSGAFFTDDFTFTGPMPMAMSKGQYLEVMTKMVHGIPNWNFNRHDLRVEGQTVIVPVQVSGTQSGTLSGLMPGMPDVPATNRSFRIVPEVMHITFRGEKISNIHVDPVPGGGVAGILEKLGVAIPVTGNKPDDPMKK